jgi:hypothetical protein
MAKERIDPLSGAEIPAEKPQPIAVDAVRKKQRKKAGDVLNERLREQQALSIEQQIADYGINEWHETFEFLASVNEVQGTNLADEKLRRLVWNILKDSPLKRANAALSDEPMLIIPHFKADKRRIWFHDLSCMWSVKACPISLDRLPEKLIQDFKVDDFSGAKTQTEKNIVKMRAIPGVKKVLDSTRYISGKNHRLSIIIPSNKVVDERYPGVPGPHPDIIGSIVSTSETQQSRKDVKLEKDLGPEPRLLKMQFFPDGYAAFRSTYYQALSYEGHETNVLISIKNAVEQLNGRFEARWRAGVIPSVKADLIERTQQICMMCGESMESPQNPYKIRVKELMDAALEFAKMESPTPAMTKMVAITRAIDTRLSDVTSLNEYNAADQQDLRSQIRKHEATFKDFRDGIKVNGEKLDFPIRHLGEELTPKQLDENIDVIKSQLGLKVKKEEKFIIRPFLTYFNAIEDELYILEKALRSRDVEEQTDAVINMHVISKFQALQTCFEHLKTFSLHPSMYRPTEIRAYLDKVKDIMAAREIFPDRIIEELEDLYELLTMSVEKLDQIFSIIQQTMDYETMKELLEEFNEELDKHDIEGDVRELMQRAE